MRINRKFHKSRKFPSAVTSEQHSEREKSSVLFISVCVYIYILNKLIIYIHLEPFIFKGDYIIIDAVFMVT